MKCVSLWVAALLLATGCRSGETGAAAGGHAHEGSAANDGHAHASAVPAATMDHAGMHGAAAPAEDHAHVGRHGGTVGMSREPSLHLEAIRTRDQVRVYVYDAAMTPIPMAEVSGRVRLTPSGSPAQTLPLESSTAEGYFFAKAPATGKIAASFEMTVQKTPVQMEFDLEATSSAASFEIGGHLARVELADGGLRVRVTEKDGKPPHGVANARVVLQLGAEKRTVPLEGANGDLAAKTELGATTPVVGVLQVDLDGKPASGRFSIDR